LKALLLEIAKTLSIFPPPRWGRVRVGVDAAVILLILRAGQSSEEREPTR
jgi:hypothetical protein